MSASFPPRYHYNHSPAGCISDKYEFYTLGSDGEKDVDGSGLLIAKEIVTGSTKVLFLLQFKASKILARILS